MYGVNAVDATTVAYVICCLSRGIVSSVQELAACQIRIAYVSTFVVFLSVLHMAVAPCGMPPLNM